MFRHLELEKTYENLPMQVKPPKTLPRRAPPPPPATFQENKDVSGLFIQHWSNLHLNREA